MNPEFVIVTGLFSLAGVVVGAVATTGTQLYLARKRESVEVRRAARLIDADLMSAEVMAEICVGKRTWWAKNQRLTSEGWQHYRDVIASELSWNDWVAVQVAVQALDDLQGYRDSALKVQLAIMANDPEMVHVLAAAERLDLDIVHPAPAISEEAAAGIEPVLAHLKKGRAALARLMRAA